MTDSMAGCGGGSCGIDREREKERQRALEAIARSYPGLSWAAFRREETAGAGLCLDRCRDLPARLEDVLPVRALPRAAEPGDLGDFLYLLCGIHAPCLFELREGRCPIDAALLRGEETYVRIALSPLGRFATLQECVFEVEDLGQGQRLVTERPRFGVENPDLKTIVKGLQGLLRKSRIVLLDFTFLLQPARETPDPVFLDLFGTQPTRWSYLFDPAPPTTTRSTVV